MIIFTGSGRSGTGLYAKLFDAHHEYRVEELIRRHFPSPLLPMPADPFADFAVRLRIMQDHLRGVDLKAFRDSSNPYVSFLDALYAIDPDVKIVLGLRDGRDFAVSGITRGYHLGGKYTGYSMTPELDDPYCPYWSLMTPIEKMAWWWTYRHRRAIERLATVPRANILVVRLEDFGGDTDLSRRTIEALEAFLGIPAHRQWLTQKYNANREQAFTPKEQWTPQMRKEFDFIAGDLMRAFGYYEDGRANRPVLAVGRP